MHLMRFKILFFVLSTLVIIPGIIFMALGGLKLGIDFTGGALLNYRFEKNIDPSQIKSVFEKNHVEVASITTSGENTYLTRTKPVEQNVLNSLRTEIASSVGKFEVRSEENVGPIIGNELKQKALLAILIACLAIVGYITWAFRKVPKPASSLRFGVAAIVALVHDVLVVVGIFAILGHFFNVEIDTLFVTAVLTVIGFSVHDTIVVFDRIRENLPKHLSKKFEEIADISITQTLGRSLNTSLTVVFVLLALLLFGGESIRWFVVALLLGIISGTYSSIFNATALLTWWEEKLGH